MTARVAIIGAGGFGARHLQALARIERPLVVDVVDPSAAARTRAAGLLDEAGGLRRGTCTMHAELGLLAVVPDLAIVATASWERAAAVRALTVAGVRRLILEKVLFPNLPDYDAIADLLDAHDVKAWVNCTRRSYPRAGELARLLRHRPIQYRVSGAGWGLASNVIHHLDEFAMLCGHTDLGMSASDLAPGWQPAKRPGYVEFFGTLTARSPDGSRFSATCSDGQEVIPGDRSIEIVAGDTAVSMRQAATSMIVVEDGRARSEPYPTALQSEATAVHVETILDGGVPTLPDYATAARLHRPMLSAFLEHLRRAAGNPALTECPIT